MSPLGATLLPSSRLTFKVTSKFDVWRNVDKRLILQWDCESLLIKSASSTGAQRALRPTAQTSSRYPFLQVMLELWSGFVMVLLVLLCGCSRCDGKQTCEVNMRVNQISDPCVGTYKYLDVTYICLPASQYSPSPVQWACRSLDTKHRLLFTDIPLLTPILYLYSGQQLV